MPHIDLNQVTSSGLTAAIEEDKQVKCPGCYDAGYSLEESIYTIDIATLTVVS